MNSELLNTPECLVEILDQVFFAFQADAQPDQVRGDTRGEKLLVAHLAVGGAGRMQAATKPREELFCVAV